MWHSLSVCEKNSRSPPEGRQEGEGCILCTKELLYTLIDATGSGQPSRQRALVCAPPANSHCALRTLTRHNDKGQRGRGDSPLSVTAHCAHAHDTTTRGRGAGA